jgi:putative DNA primase/helicase
MEQCTRSTAESPQVPTVPAAGHAAVTPGQPTGSPNGHSVVTPTGQPPWTKAIGQHGLTKALADAICTTDHFARDASGKLYRYHEGVYRRYAERYIHSRVKALLIEAELAAKWSTTRAQEVLTYIAVDVPDLDETPSLQLLNLHNGLYDIRQQTLLDHTPAFRSQVQLPISYDPDAPATVWETFESQVLPADCKGLMFQLAAWLMLPHKHIQKAVMLLGEGGNGKSTLLSALRAFVGKAHTTSIPLQKLEVDRFAVIRLLGKLVNICPDLPSTYLETTSTFKALTGFNDSLDGERKYVQDTIEFEPFCRLLFSANRPPRSSDDSQAFFDRWVVVPCEAQFRGTAEEKTPEEMATVLTAPYALSGALNKALTMLSVIQQQGIPLTPSMEKAFQEFRETTDPLAIWLDRNTVVSMGACTIKKELVDRYNKECDRRNRTGITTTSMTKSLRRLRPMVMDTERRVNGKKEHVYSGLALKSTRQEGDHANHQDDDDVPF